ncbi:nuclear transport factor 2 family protein [Spirillospora sp. NPDC029432]|uniref:nuclear transport factor 2 family protein n=1 Tax=Spirillospora sp. NPDC029432 TaxID=3154599 RepID=UPI003451723B
MSVSTTSRSIEHIYAEVQQFYARHMQLLDAGEAEEWAMTFTEDGVFAPPSLPEPIRGRANLAAGARKAAEERAAAGETHRHWQGMIAVDPRPDESLHVTCYTQVLVTPRNGSTRLHLMCVCRDVLVRENGRLLVRERRVTRDDRP